MALFLPACAKAVLLWVWITLVRWMQERECFTCSNIVDSLGCSNRCFSEFSPHFRAYTRLKKKCHKTQKHVHLSGKQAIIYFTKWKNKKNYFSRNSRWTYHEVNLRPRSFQLDVLIQMYSFSLTLFKLYHSLTPGASSMIFWCLLWTLQSLSNR